MVYQNTFITVAEDTKALEPRVPKPSKTDIPGLTEVQFKLLTENPYEITQDELNFAVYCARSGMSDVQLEREHDAMRAAFFSKGHPCLRASGLTKSHGWGAHYDDKGRIALYGLGTDEYLHYAGDDKDTEVIRAMRNKRA